jgi:hypothetical protein
MTPKQKAIEIVEKYEKYLYDKNTQDQEWVKCVECAIIAVDEIINSLPPYEYGLEFVAKFQYWLDVKTEIDAL